MSLHRLSLLGLRLRPSTLSVPVGTLPTRNATLNLTQLRCLSVKPTKPTSKPATSTPSTPAKPTTTTTPTTPAPTSDEALLFPNPLLIYHTAGRPVLLGLVSATSVLLTTFSAILVAPTLYPVYGPIASVASIFLGSLPLTITTYFSSPYVHNIRLRVPPAWARATREGLWSYVRQGLNSPEALQDGKPGVKRGLELEITTGKILGRPNVWLVGSEDLEFGKWRGGCANLKYKGTKRKDMFYVDEGMVEKGVVLEKGIMKEILEAIKKKSGKK
ncbi:hypothetical protein BJ508DRAFT_413403 [Ascobolus immersus RN42]|uniref:DUF1783-domain-containing protein n=1 Tax=Ascobolus immersus RN42 TaxID=1160509 RepID=A0A3N4ID30_ASCIM|nr:hypothetical protein BJ508DRAFT_413403 [Ascobolus immersus RN42]